MDKATVIIAAWNAADTIFSSIYSAIDQEGVESIALVADDASEDRTADIAQKCGAQVVRLGRNGGPGAARNAALDAAETEWIAVLDSDDAITPGRTRAMIDLARQYRADVVLGNFQRVDETGHAVDPQPYLHGPAFDAPRLMTLENYVAEDQTLTGGRSLGYLKPMLRRDFLEQHGIRYDPSIWNGEDFHLILACLAAGARVVFSPAPDYLYTTRRGSISHRINPAHIGPLIAADDAFVARHAARLSDASRQLFTRRRAGLLRLQHSEMALQSLKGGRPAAALHALAKHPPAAGTIVTKLLEAGSKRLRPRGKTT